MEEEGGGRGYLRELSEVRRPVFAVQLEEFVDVLSALDLREDSKVLQRQLDSHFDSVQVKEVHLTLAHQLACQFIRHQRLRALVVLQVVPASNIQKKKLVTKTNEWQRSFLVLEPSSKGRPAVASVTDRGERFADTGSKTKPNKKPKKKTR